MQSKIDTDDSEEITRTPISAEQSPVVVELSSQGNVLSKKTFKLDLKTEVQKEDEKKDVEYDDTDLL